MMRRSLALVLPILAGLLAACESGKEREPRPDVPAPVTTGALVELGGRAFRASGPYRHGAIEVVLLHSDAADDREFLTLDEGIAGGLVEVTEKGEAQVSELVIENRSEKPLFVQEGDRLRGGKQDRTVFSSFVVPPRSGKVPVRTFCIEAGRWEPGATGDRFLAAANPALASKAVRNAAKYQADQRRVWDEVAREKGRLGSALAVVSSTSSLNEAFDSGAARRLSDECIAALGSLVERHSDSVGVAIAVNGKVEEIDVYPSRALLAKVYPRLLASYAIQGAGAKGEAAPIGAAEVRAFAAAGAKKSERRDAIDARNACEVLEDEKTYRSTTLHDGRPVQYQVMGK